MSMYRPGDRERVVLAASRRIGNGSEPLTSHVEIERSEGPFGCKGCHIKIDTMQSHTTCHKRNRDITYATLHYSIMCQLSHMSSHGEDTVTIGFSKVNLRGVHFRIATILDLSTIGKQVGTRKEPTLASIRT